MRYLVFGCGKIGKVIAYYLSILEDTNSLVLVDLNQDSLDEVEKHINKYKKNSTLEVIKCQGSFIEVDQILSRYPSSVLISAASYEWNVYLTQVAIDNSCHMVDLGGHNSIVDLQLELNDKAREKGVTIIPDCGLAPGLAAYCAALYAEEFEMKFGPINSIKVYVGGLPVFPRPPFNYQLVFSEKGLINEYVEDSIVIKNNQIQKVESLTEIEELVESNIGRLEAFHTSGGISRLPQFMLSRVNNLEYKTVRYPGHCNIFYAMKKLGLLHGDSRKIVENSIKNNLNFVGRDLVFMGIKIENKHNKMMYSMLEYDDLNKKHSAMARCTAYPTAILAHNLATGYIAVPGVKFGEEVLEPWFLKDIGREFKINLTSE